LARSFAALDQEGGFDEKIIRDIGAAGFLRYLVDRFLHFLHHYWIGLLLMAYGLCHEEVFWFGYGLFVEDAAYHTRITATIKRGIGALFKEAR